MKLLETHDVAVKAEKIRCGSNHLFNLFITICRICN